MTEIQPVPPGAGESATRLWYGILAEFELSAAEMEILREAVRVSTLIDRLEAEIEGGELVVTDKRGELKSAPAVVESRQQRAILLRLLSSLRLPDAESGERPQHRGSARGSYGMARGRATGRVYGSLNAVSADG